MSIEQGAGSYNPLRHTDNIRYFSGLSLTQNRREVYMLYLAREGGNLDMLLLRKR